MKNTGPFQPHRLVRGLALALSGLVLTVVVFLWWGLFNLPTDPVGGISSAEGLQVTRPRLARAGGEADAPPALAAGDLLVRARGRDWSEWLEPDLARGLALLRDSREGQVVEYTVRRGQAIQTVSWPLARLNPAEGAWPVLLGLCTALVFLLTGTFVVWQRPSDAAARAIALFFGAIALNFVDDPVNETNLTWLLAFDPYVQLIEFATFWLVPSSGLHFSLIFPRRRPVLERYPWLVWVIYLVNPIVSLAAAMAFGRSVFSGLFTSQAESARYIVGGALALGAIVNLARSLVTARTPVERAQMRWLAWGAAVGVIPWLLGFIAPLIIGGVQVGIVQAAVLWALLAAMPLSLAFAILRYRLMDIDTVIQRSLVYAALSAVLVGVYVLLATILSGLFRLLSGSPNDSTVVFLSTLGAALVFAPARARIQAAIDRLFYRQQLNWPARLAEWSKTLATLLDAGRLKTLLVETAPAQLGLERAGLWVWDEAQEQFASLDANVLAEQQPAQALAAALLAADAPMFAAPLDAPPDPVLAPLRRQQLDVAVPLVAGDKLVGVYAVGGKRSGVWYSRAELEFLETLGHQAATALENARLVEQVAQQERVKHELDIARNIQMSLLPERGPDWPGLDVYGMSQPAREVGGDFYSYFTLRDGAAAVAVGDVSGKGIPGALFMAVALGVMRVQAPSFRKASELMQTLNTALYAQMIATHMNVALAYAVLSPADDGAWSLHTSNAGLVAPLVLTRSGVCAYLSACGLPLGATQFAQYYDVQARLAPGDVLTLCSDGIVEAMDAGRHLFGFARVQEALAALRDRSAAEIANGLVAAAREFAGPVEFDDDVTIVVVKVL